MVGRILIKTSSYVRSNSSEPNEIVRYLCIFSFRWLSFSSLYLNRLLFLFSLSFFHLSHKILWRKLNDQTKESHTFEKLWCFVHYLRYTMNRKTRARSTMWFLILALYFVYISFIWHFTIIFHPSFIREFLFARAFFTPTSFFLLFFFRHDILAVRISSTYTNSMVSSLVWK